jgi:hypothetical protein
MTRIAPEILGKFNWLLFPMLVHRDPLPDLNLFGLKKFGDTLSSKIAPLPDRREQLHDAIALLQGKADLNAVFEILDRARQARIRSALEDYRIKKGRHFGRMQKEAFKGLKALRRLSENYQCSDDTEQALKAISVEPLLKFDWQSRKRDPEIQPEPWLKEARQKLSAAKVPKEIRQELLEAVGLIPDKEFEIQSRRRTPDKQRNNSQENPTRRAPDKTTQ